ncbi:transposase [Halobium palmae]|uniref:Transposase n=1 Tax=Halobium palmae TaxID=1776492 RepID=A0ABD5RUZ5_9EURY
MTSSHDPLEITELQTARELLVDQASTLLEGTQNISRTIGSLQFPTEIIDQWVTYKSNFMFSTESMVRVFIYMHACDYTQDEVANRIQSWPYLQLRFNLQRSVSQGTISHTKRRRFSPQLRRLLKAIGNDIRVVAAENDLDIREVSAPTPIDQPSAQSSEAGSETREPITHFVDRHASDLLETAGKHVFPAFDTGRAANVKHEDEAVWESQTRMSLLGDRTGSRTVYRTFNRQLDDALHHDTHTRAVKKCATPGSYQYTLGDFDTASTNPTPSWRRCAETLQDSFDESIAGLLEVLQQTEMITEPVVAAIDITEIPFYVSPWKAKSDIQPDDPRIELGNGKQKVPKADYPEMVSGCKDPGTYGYKYATLTVIGRDAPIVLAIEPIRENSTWEGETGETTPLDEAVDRLMERATAHLDIHLVMADRGFDGHRVPAVLDSYDVDYLIPKKKYPKDWAAIENIREHPTADIAVEPDVDLHPAPDYEYSHTTNIMYVPPRNKDFIAMEDEEGERSFAVFVTNREDVSPDDAMGLTARYSSRWDIENEYRSIKRFLPSVASKDYRVRCFSFVWATLLYNVWRLVDAQLQVLVGEAYDEYEANPVDGRPDTLLTAVGSVFTLMDSLEPPD